MRSTLKKLHWADYLIAALLIGLLAFVWYRVSSVLNYNWRWDIIPNYIIRWDANTQSWVSNILLDGFLGTLRISIYASILALIFGILIGSARTSQNLTIRMLSRTYVEVLRNIPPIVVIFIFFFFLSDQIANALNLEGWARRIAKGDNAEIWSFFFGDMRRFPSLISGVVALALLESAFVAEIVRAGIQAIPQGQHDAAKALGMSWSLQMRLVVLPQAIRKMLPPLTNQLIALIKDSAIISVISVQELTLKTLELVTSTRAIFEAWITTAFLYFILCFAASLLFRVVERRFGQNTI